MRQLFVAGNPPEAHLLEMALLAEEIQAHVENEVLPIALHGCMTVLA